mgnify:CR=1 FL=1
MEIVPVDDFRDLVPDKKYDPLKEQPVYEANIVEQDKTYIRWLIFDVIKL